MILDYYNIKSTCCGSRFIYVQKNDNTQYCSCNCKKQKITFFKASTKNLIEVVFFNCIETYMHILHLPQNYSTYSKCIMDHKIFSFIISNNEAYLDHEFSYVYYGVVDYLNNYKVNDLKEYFESDYLSDLWLKINKLKDNLIFQ